MYLFGQHVMMEVPITVDLEKRMNTIFSCVLVFSVKGAAYRVRVSDCGTNILGSNLPAVHQ